MRHDLLETYQIIKFKSISNTCFLPVQSSDLIQIIPLFDLDLQFSCVITDLDTGLEPDNFESKRVVLILFFTNDV